MDASRKLIVGYDLCEDITQISCYSYKTMQPIPICQREGDENSCLIPTVLCVKSDTRQWLFGEEARDCAEKGSGILVDRILTKLKNGEVTELYQTKFTGVLLLEKFLRKTLTLIKNYFPTETITKLVITIHETEPELVDKIYEALALLGIEKDRSVVISHASAYLYYALCQDKSLWMNDVGMFDFSDVGLRFYQIRINHRSKPKIAGLSKVDYSKELNQEIRKQTNCDAGYIFENITNTALFKQMVTTLYLTGIGFEGGWADDVIKGLCAGRRVFYGQNLFTKGACYAAKELSGDSQLNDIILLNDDMVTTSVALRVYCDTKYMEVPLVEAGATWYEVNSSIEVIPEGQAELDLILKDIMSRNVIREKIVLDQFSVRTDRTTRLGIQFTCENKDKGCIRVKELGFGEFFPESGNEMLVTLEI